MLDKLIKYIKTSTVSLPLTIVLSFSPLPPLTTLLYLGQLGQLEAPSDLVDPGELKAQGYSEDFIRIYDEAMLSQRTGKRDNLLSLLEEKINNMKVSLEIMDYNVNTVMEVLSVVTIVIPLLLASIMIFIDVSLFTPVTLTSSIFGAMIALAVGIYAIPYELWLRMPSLTSLVPLVITPLIYYITGNMPLSLLVAAGASMPLVFKEERKAIRVFDEAKELVVKATASRNPILAGIDLDDLLSDRFYGVAKATTTTLYILYTQGGSRYREGVAKLLAFIRSYVSTFKGVRRKALQSFFYALIMAAITAASMAIIVTIVEYIVGLPLSAQTYVGFTLPRKEDMEMIREGAQLFISLSALAYALISSCMRDGNPLYFPLYLFPILGLSYVSYYLTLHYAPAIMGVAL